ncbi:MAG: hypothetical protein HUU01_19280 [Saprospiraceae bacterium]|nr:hypothetical protein [Saprospiraceae bacterium]
MPGLLPTPIHDPSLQRLPVLVLPMLLFWLFANPVKGQEGAGYSVRYLGLKEGLSSRDVKDIYHDKKGLVWVATSNGLNRYDGREVKIYSNAGTSPVLLPTSHIRSVAEDQEQHLIICSDAGLLALSPSRLQLVPPSQLGVPDSVARHTNCLVERLQDGRLILLAGSAIYLLDQGTTTEWFRLPPGYAQTVKGICYSNKDSTLYLRTNSLELGLLAIRDKRLESLNFLIYNEGNTSAGKPTPFSKQSSGMLNSLGDSMTLFWQTGVGIRMQINRKAGQFVRMKDELLTDILPHWNAVQQYVHKLDETTLPGSMRGINLRLCTVDKREVYWLGTNVGVFIVNTTKKAGFRQFSFLQNKSIRSIREDEEGRLLVGTYNGLFKFDPRQALAKKMPEIKPVLDLLPVGSNRYWLTLERFNGLRLFDNTANRLLDFYPNAPQLSFVNDLARSGSTVWLAAKIDQVYCLDIADGRILHQVSLTPYPLSGPDIPVKSLLPAKDGSIWLATEKGLYRLLPTKRGTFEQDTISVPAALRASKINALYEDSAERIWIGTDGQGMVVLSSDSGEERWYNYHNGLANNVVYSILGSRRDSLLWVGTLNGMSCLDTKAGVFNNFYHEHGLAGNEFNSGAYYHAKDGRLYFGGVNGITHFDPEQIITKPLSLKTGIIVEMPNVPGRSPVEWIPQAGEIMPIPPSETLLEIHFFSSELFEADKVRYRYLISGLFDTWQYSDARSKLVLRRLSPGHYPLRVQAITTAGNWSQPFSVVLYILPEYYQTWWFRTLVGMLIVAFLFGVYRFRIWQIQREYSIRSQIVHDLHDDFGSRLFALRAMASKIASPKTKPADLETLFTQFETTSKNAYAAMRDFIWAFDPKSDHLDGLIERMADFAENTIRPIVKVLKIHEGTVSPRDALIKPVLKHHTLMIFQEILTNVAKHTLSQTLEIEFSEKNQHLYIHILNRYNGLHPATSSSVHKGKESINARLLAIKGQLKWEESDGIQDILVLIPI